MSLSVGIVGLPNAGKSTLFNALATRRLAETAPRPFTTIEPHEAVVAVPDPDLDKLSLLVKPDTTAPATITFIDIAGLVKGAHQGEGLGNQFLGKIREVDAIAHVARAFSDPYVTHAHPTHEPGTLEQIVEDIEIVNLELELAGITGKHSIYVLNFGEGELKDPKVQDYITSIENKFGDKAISVSAKLEEEMTDLSQEERRALLKEMGIAESGLEKLIKTSYKLLDLISFYTIKGGKELHAWSLKNGASAIEAAEVVHTDFAKGFIKAEVISVDELFEVGDWNQAKEKGKLRLEGRDYKVLDKDVIEFKTSS